MIRLALAKTCSVDWSQLTGSTYCRHCEQCDRHVYNLSAGTRLQAVALFHLYRETPPCVRFNANADGSVQFLSEHKAGWAKCTAIPLTMTVVLGLTACSTWSNTDIASRLPPHCEIEQIDSHANEQARETYSSSLRPRNPQCLADAKEDALQSGIMGEVTPINCALPRGFLFSKGQSDLSDSAKEELNAIREILRLDPTIGTIVIRGHASADETNAKELSLQRATVVRDYLTNHHRTSHRFQIEGWSDTHPVTAINGTIINTESRRVEFEIVTTCTKRAP